MLPIGKHYISVVIAGSPSCQLVARGSPGRPSPHARRRRKTLTAFNRRLREEIDLDALHEEIPRVVRVTSQPEHASLWLRPHVANTKEDVPR